jgi:rRNA biogenesis protein RRP5
VVGKPADLRRWRAQEEEEAVGMQGGGNESDDNDSSSEEEEEEGEGEEDEAPKLKSMAAAAPVADDAMDWEDEVTRALTGEAANSAAGEAAEDGAATKKSKREKKRAKEEREAMVAAAEKARLHGDSAPASVEEFEKALLTAGNSSFVWIKWLAWHVSRSEVEKARAVAEKALATIHYREDAERQNVWLAYLNLENLYGLPTPAEAVRERGGSWPSCSERDLRVEIWACCVRGLSQADARAMRTVNTGTRVELRR